MKFSKKEIFTISNGLSLLRLLISIPAYYLLSIMQNDDSVRYFLLALLLFAAFTDFLDGFFARKYKEITEFGKIIDPLGDKVLVAVIVIKLFYLNEIPAFYFYSVIIRDVLIFAAGLIITKKIGKVLPSNLLGKITVTVIAFFIIVVILNLNKIIYDVFLYGSLIFVFGSLIGYAIRGYEALNWHKEIKSREKNEFFQEY